MEPTASLSERSVPNESVLLVIIGQRNQALDELAKYTAYAEQLERENAELRKKLSERG
ncbi:hypothetical protein Aph01nite_43900 [Acrocarpospora phusangensis]|uniref:Uncharacterized protein n=1 Tax=Acrocarpospora phusangensis TaxID=1070424 RepID=A0A919QGK5_9ACTN|nr:hypothetical protein Aph01nite_43900 [Acrocarpospora phusangensis]